MDTKSPLRLSVLDLTPVPSGTTSAEALQNSLDLARHVDQLGYTRYWLSEHHNSSMLASAAPEIMIGHIASVTQKMKIGSGGVMLPNNTPLKVVETFRLLEALHPGRIDLGIGRAPGTDQLTALALRRSTDALTAEDFPQQVGELLAFFNNDFPDDHPFRKITAIPEGVNTPDIYLLGSSDFSAQLSAALGLGFAFAHHISPGPAIKALNLYRDNFRRAEFMKEPTAFLAISVICADTDEQAEELALSSDLTMLRMSQGRVPGAIPSVEEAKAYPFTTLDRELMRQNRSRAFVGSPETLRPRLLDLADRAGVNELMITTLVHDHEARKHSYELLAAAFLSPVTV